MSIAWSVRRCERVRYCASSHACNAQKRDSNGAHIVGGMGRWKRAFGCSLKSKFSCMQCSETGLKRSTIASSTRESCAEPEPNTRANCRSLWPLMSTRPASPLRRAPSSSPASRGCTPVCENGAGDGNTQRSESEKELLLAQTTRLHGKREACQPCPTSDGKPKGVAFKIRPTFSPTLRGADPPPPAAPLCREKEERLATVGAGRVKGERTPELGGYV